MGVMIHAYNFSTGEVQIGESLGQEDCNLA